MTFIEGGVSSSIITTTRNQTMVPRLQDSSASKAVEQGSRGSRTRSLLAGTFLSLILVACGGATLSLTEYVDGLNTLVSETTDELEVADARFRQIPEPNREDAIALLNSHVVLRTDIQNGLETLDAPAQIADLHVLLIEGHAAVLAATELLPGRVETAASPEEFEQSAELEAYETANAETMVICRDIQAQLDATADRGVFQDVPWIPDEMKEVVIAVLGCDERIGE